MFGNRKKYPFLFLLKTYVGDCLFVQRLLNSFQKYNVEGIEMCLVTSECDWNYFLEKFDEKLLKNIFFVPENLFTEYLTETDVRGIRPGYINQEVIKLAFHELNLCDVYCPIDSDGEFIRPFGYKDFVTEDGIPYTVLVEDNELKVDPVYWYDCNWAAREELIRKIGDSIEYNPKHLLTAHGFCVLSCLVLDDFRKNFMEQKGYSYLDLMEIAPYEFSWYNLWLQKTKCIPILFREPLFKYFHTLDQFLFYKVQGITLEDISRGYLGIVVNSNFQSRAERPLSYEDDFSIYPPPLHIYQHHCIPIYIYKEKRFLGLSFKQCLLVMADCFGFIVRKILKRFHV